MRTLVGVGRRARTIARLSARSLWLGVLGFYRGDNLTYAASIAYYALLSLFPFSLLAVSILGSATAGEGDRAIVLAFVPEYFPKQFEFITAQLDAFRTQSVTFGVAGTMALIWGALGVFGAVSTAVNYAWRVEKTRPYWRHQLVSFLMLMAALLLVSASNVVGATWFAGVLSRFPGLLVLRGLALANAATALFVLVVGLVFCFVPNTNVRFPDVWIGACLTGLLWKAALQAFSWYMRDMTRFTRVNGSIAAVVVFLVWVYVQAVILL